MRTCKQCIYYAYRPLRNGWVKRHLCTSGVEREILYNELPCPRFERRKGEEERP